MKTYLQQIGLQLNGTAVNQFVSAAEAWQPPSLTLEALTTLYQYPVPAPSDNGACALKAKDPYDLRPILNLEDEDLTAHPETQRLQRLNHIVEKLQAATGVDWLGIYRQTDNLDGESVLLKEAYYGRFSRAEFPLTESFAKSSNNSTVGLTKRAIVVQRVDEYEGPYYTCDKTVQSEFCVPILSEAGNLLGIIDAEAFEPDFFTDEKLLEITKVAADLGATKLLNF